MKGFTLIELVVAVAISSILLIALIRFMGTAIPAYRSLFLQTLADETARVQLVRISHALRAARYGDTGAFPIVEATPSRIIFYANTDSDTATERVRYELVGTDLIRGITKPSGNPLVYNTAQETTVTVARSIQNGATPVFSYYGNGYPGTTTPAADISDITYVSFSLIIDADTAQNPPAATVQSQVQLRNLKTNL